ncbi:MAG: DEAD/DEAH box helicase [Candidatus Omnitrophica bacterium]|nr:DEAD/DEAH box helicase [Candidatus Omnitrophota bacterium]
MQYDRFQQEAIEYIDQKYSVIVSAPTGAGKTAIAEYVIAESLKTGQSIIYTAPIKALSNQKFRDFQEQFPGKIGILTGDVSLNPQAQVLVMTTEIFRNKILDAPQELEKYSWVIFDEIHYIDNEERGTVWEESLIFMPKHIRLLALSATIPNIKEFSQWIESVQKNPLKIVIENKRPVPLHFLFQCKGQVIDNLSDLNKLLSSRSRKKFLRANRLQGLIDYIQRNNGMPCIWFVFSRRLTEDLAFELFSFDFLDKEEKEQISSLYNRLCERYDLAHEESAKRLFYLIQKGIAFHHAGMLPTLKEVIERLFTSRLLKVIFTTETFALGINMPARSVVFNNLDKYYGRYVRVLKVRDFYQMAWRAGRRGMDKAGLVYCRVNPRFVNFEQVKQMIDSSPEEVKSRFNTSYATLLNLYQRYKERILEIYPLTLHYFQSRKHQKKQAIELMQAKLNLLKDSGYIEDSALTHKGLFARSVYGYELILSELYEQRVLEELDEFTLGILSVAVVFEPRKNQRLSSIPKTSRGIKDSCEKIYESIKAKEIKYRIYPISKMPYFHLSKATQAWLSGMQFSKIVSLTDTDEGELIRYFRMAVQILREINSSTAASPQLQQRTSEVMRILNRGVVDAEKQLRI